MTNTYILIKNPFEEYFDFMNNIMIALYEVNTFRSKDQKHFTIQDTSDDLVTITLTEGFAHIEKVGNSELSKNVYESIKTFTHQFNKETSKTL